MDPVAAHIGKRIRDRREVLGLTSDDVARRVGMSLQQAEECEKGLCAVSGQDLWRFCQVLEVEPNYFSSVCRKNYSAQRRNAARAPQGRIIRHTAEPGTGKARDSRADVLLLQFAAARASFILLSDERDNVFCFERTGNLTRPIVRETAGLPGQAGQ